MQTKNYQIVFAKEFMGPSGEKILEPATLTSAANKLFKSNDPHTSLKLLKQGINDAKFSEREEKTFLR